jgi:RNA polymerase sigma factor (sigma-70 family)
MSTATTPRSLAAPPGASAAWRERSARLYEELKRPSQALVRRAFQGAFTDDEIEDIYSSAWLGTLRALGRRHQELGDQEVRKYLLTAVARNASKEMRRRRRKPVSPLEGLHGVPDDSLPPDEATAKREQSRVARDVLSSLPPRRRAVMLLRYGWGLEPHQVCALVKGLSPRAYRKEITRGIDELTAKLRRVESGEWCIDREPLLKAYASGLADEEQRRQAQQHLSHCRHCTDFVGKLSGHLHDIGSAAAVPAASDLVGDGRVAILDRAADALQRVKESTLSAVGRGAGHDAGEASAQTLGASGGARGAGAAGTGALAKLAGAGAGAKLTAACLSGGVAATACLATGVLPARLPDIGGGDPAKRATPAADAKRIGHPARVQTERLGAPYEGVDAGEPAPKPNPAPPTTTTTPVAPPPPTTTTTTTTTPTYTTATTTTAYPVEPSTPPTEQEYGVASAATPSSSESSSTSSGGDGSGSAVKQEFGP